MRQMSNFEQLHLRNRFKPFENENKMKLDCSRHEEGELLGYGELQEKLLNKSIFVIVYVTRLKASFNFPYY